MRSSAAAVMPIQPGRIAEEPTVPSPWSIGPGRPMPAPITVSRATPASASVSTTSSAAISRPSWASWSVSSGRVRSARIVRREVGDRDAQVRVAEVDADGGARGGVEGEQDRRAAALGAVAPSRAPGARPPARRPAGRRRGWRPWSGAGPCGARCRRGEIWPSSRSARITRRRLRRRSDSSEPARPGGMESVALERSGDGPSTYRTDRPPDRAD